MAEEKKQLSKKQREVARFAELLRKIGFDVIVVDGENLRKKR